MRVESDSARTTVDSGKETKSGYRRRLYSLFGNKQFSPLLHLAVAVGTIAAPLLWHLSCYWQIDPQYRYGWIVPLLSIYLAWRRWPSRPAVAPALKGTTACLVAALFLLSLVWLVREATPDWSVVSWILAMLTVGSLFLLVTSAGGLCTARHFLFPICFILIAVPWPHSVEFAITQNLMRFVASAAAECANWAGIAALPEGNLIRLTQGYVGIDEACSGIRSLQAVLMASLFLGELQRYPVFKRGLLILLGSAIAVVCNVARTFALVLIVSWRGEGTLNAWHDPMGLGVLITAFALLGLIASWMSAGKSPESGNGEKQRISAQSRWSLPSAEVGAICVWAIATFAATEYWYGRGEPASVHLEIHWPENWSAFRYLPMSDDARHNLLCSEGQIANWIDSDGGNWTLIALRWAPGRTAIQSARLHRPENCFTAFGAVLRQELGRTTIMVDAVPITFRSYLFEHNGTPLIVFYTIWEEANPHRSSGSALEDYSGLSRLQRVLTHERNLGQQSLEFVLAGRTDFTDVKSKFERILPFLLSWKSA